MYPPDMFFVQPQTAYWPHDRALATNVFASHNKRLCRAMQIDQPFVVVVFPIYFFENRNKARSKSFPLKLHRTLLAIDGVVHGLEASEPDKLRDVCQ